MNSSFDLNKNQSSYIFNQQGQLETTCNYSLIPPIAPSAEKTSTSVMYQQNYQEQPQQQYAQDSNLNTSYYAFQNSLQNMSSQIGTGNEQAYYNEHAAYDANMYNEGIAPPHNNNYGQITKKPSSTKHYGKNSSRNDFNHKKSFPVYPPNSRLFIGNLNVESTSKEELQSIFSKYGTITEISLQSTFGFVQFETIESCDKAIQFEQGKKVGSSVWDLKYSKAKSRPYELRMAARDKASRGGNSDDREKKDWTRKDGDHDRSVRGGDRYRDEDRDSYKSRRRSRSPPPRKRSRSPDYHSSSHYKSSKKSSRSPPRRRSRSPAASQQSVRLYSLANSNVLNNFQNTMMKSIHLNGQIKAQEDLILPRKVGNQVADAQIICFSVDNFETSFLSQRFNPKSLVKQRMSEGVKAVFYLDRKGQRAKTVDFQIFHIDSTITEMSGITIEKSVRALERERDFQRAERQLPQLQNPMPTQNPFPVNSQNYQYPNSVAPNIQSSAPVDLLSLLNVLQSQQSGGFTGIPTSAGSSPMVGGSDLTSALLGLNRAHGSLQQQQLQQVPLTSNFSQSSGQLLQSSSTNLNSTSDSNQSVSDLLKRLQSVAGVVGNNNFSNSNSSPQLSQLNNYPSNPSHVLHNSAPSTTATVPNVASSMQQNNLLNLLQNFNSKK
ncbi:hypothetical protein HK099_002337 [Clydaea vesicula]|uniref:RRM domain-containing protein n=1 Tax=Clydaea vesicula TaxID=447962 RepID=A0AAD5U2X7_9FUNG|nr:hypothetical protein HK099_002337 [Clydaea vesicula]